MSERNALVSTLKAARSIALAFAALLLVFVGGCSQTPSGPTKVIQLKGMTATLTGEFRTGGSTVGIKFADAQGRPVDVGNVNLALKMDMSGMPMIAGGEISGSGGNYTAKVKPQMGGAWVATLRYNGPQGSGETSFEVNVR